MSRRKNRNLTKYSFTLTKPPTHPRLSLKMKILKLGQFPTNNSFFRLSYVNSQARMIIGKALLVVWFELEISGVGSDLSANCVTTTVQKCKFRSVDSKQTLKTLRQHIFLSSRGKRTLLVAQVETHRTMPRGPEFESLWELGFFFFSFLSLSISHVSLIRCSTTEFP